MKVTPPRWASIQVSWVVSSIQSSPALATTCGLFAAFLAAAPHEEPDFVFPLIPLIFVMIAVGCFWIGSRYYLRVDKP